MAASAGTRFDVAAFIDERPIGWREITTLVVVSVALFIEVAWPSEKSLIAARLT